MLSAKADPSIAESLSKTGRGFSPLHAASRNGNIEIMKALVAAAASPIELVNAISIKLGSPIHVASRALNWDAVVYLTTLTGVNVNAKDYDGNTPLHITAALMTPVDAAAIDEVLKPLIGAGADINAKVSSYFFM